MRAGEMDIGSPFSVPGSQFFAGFGVVAVDEIFGWHSFFTFGLELEDFDGCLLCTSCQQTIVFNQQFTGQDCLL